MRERDNEAAGRGRSFLLLPSKVTCPTPETGTVTRARVREKLTRSLTCPVTTVVAPAGFGKTTAVAAWAASLGCPVAWCSLDEDDGDPARFWHAVGRALATADGRLDGILNAAEVSWTEAVEARAALTELLVALGAFSDTLVLILEDVHSVSSSPVVADTLSFFLRNLPPSVHVVLTSRTPVGIPLAKMRVRGELVEIDQDDLRLSPSEQAQLFDAAAMGLGDEERRLLAEATQGWPAGCRLLEMRCRQSGGADVAEVMRGARESVSAYLFEEVLEELPDDLLRFMTETAIVESFTAALAARIAGCAEAEARQRVDRLVDAGLFIQRLEGKDGATWYRYHAMLRELLHTRLRRMDESRIAVLVDTARSWLLEEGFDDAAVGLSFWMRDWEAICAIIEQRWKSLYMNDELDVVLRWIDLLPEGVLEQRPFLCAVAALPATYAGNSLRGRQLIQRALLGLEEGDDFLFAFCMVQKAFLASLGGAPEECVAFAEKALRFLPDEERYLRGMMMQVSASARGAADPLVAIAGYREALPLQRAVGNANLLASALCNLAVFEASAGHLDAAGKAAEEALALYEPSVRPAKPMLAFAHRVLAECAYERGDVARFESECERFCAMASRGTVPARAAEVAVLEAKQAQRAGSMATSREAFARAMAVDESAALQALPTLSLMRDWLQGRAGDAAAVGGEGAARLTFAAVLGAMASGRDGAAESALSLAEAVPADDAALKARACAVAAIAAERTGRARQAVVLAREAWEVSRRWGLNAAFTENARDMLPLAGLLRAEVAAGERAGAGGEALASDRAAAAAIEEAARGPVRAADMLTERELDVLRVVAEGASVAAAAEALVVSRETVKKHLGNIYAKLGVHSKMQAVALLREEGVL